MRNAQHVVGSLVVVLVSAGVLPGCATSSTKIAPAYVPPTQYASFDCTQMHAEMQRLHGRVSQLAGRLDGASMLDKALTGMGAVLMTNLWTVTYGVTALAYVGGTKSQEMEYARLKGEHLALVLAGSEKRCLLDADGAATGN